MSALIWETNLSGAKLLSRGKVRDIYEVDGKILLVATDRLSAFDVVLPTPIPNKGKVLTQMSAFWFDHFKNVIPNHVVSTNPRDYPQNLQDFRDQLEGRSMLVKKAKVFPVECVARGYLIGSGWKDYQSAGSVCGIKLRPGLHQASKLDRPIFTPATKAKTGHDENIGFDVVAATLGKKTAITLHDLTLAIYGKASAYAESKGVILADTKFEFGMVDDRITLIDEVLTPDSSRYWPRSGYRVGISPPSFDKQFVRDYLEEIRFNKKPPGPVLPDEIVRKTSEKYLEAFRILTGRELGA
ncbi:MAG TPA: phosphoribosylaminoimidazolesuccinocarboxamide synthase [Planctomycetota bacterium]|nr:phosphoribosylaminoimidazolesuccinocarboxamide synthase [Planctomycetota bacterium]